MDQYDDLRIVLPSPIICIAILYIHVKPEHSKITLTHAQLSHSTTLPIPIVYREGPTSHT